MLLVIPQFTVWTFMLVWLIDEKGWSILAAEPLVAATQVLGAAGRIGAGAWSDRVGGRLGPMRPVAVAAAVVMLALGVLEGTPVAIALMVDRDGHHRRRQRPGLHRGRRDRRPLLVGSRHGHPEHRAVPDGRRRRRRSSVRSSAARGYGWAFAAVAVFPLLAIALVPVQATNAGNITGTPLWLA